MNYKKIKNIAVLICIIIILVCISAVASSCAVLDGSKEEIIYKITAPISDKTVDIGSTLEVPKGSLTKEGEVVDMSVSVKVEKYINEIPVTILQNAGTVRIDDKGLYRITYSAKNAEKLIIEITCADISGPVVTMTGVIKNANVNETLVLPDFSYSDKTGINWDTSSLELFYLRDGVRENYLSHYDNMTRSFIPEETGFYVVKIRVLDILGNASEYEWEIMVIDPNWTIAVPNPAIALFDGNDYLNLFTSGTFNEYESINSYEWLEEFDSKDNIIKITSEYSQKITVIGQASVNIRFPSAIRRSDIPDGTSISIKVNFPDKNFQLLSLFRYNEAGFIDEINNRAYAYNRHIMRWQNIGQGWCTLNIMPKALDLLQDSNGYIQGFGLGLRRTEGETDSKVTFYIGEIAQTTVLASPEVDFSAARTAVWSAVSGAEHYLITTDGVRTTTSELTYSVPEDARNVSIQAIPAESEIGLASSEETPFWIFGKAFRKDYFAAFDDVDYGKYYLSNIDGHGGIQWIPASVGFVLDANTQSLKVDYKQNDQNRSRIGFYFPKAVTALNGDFVMKYKGPVPTMVAGNGIGISPNDSGSPAFIELKTSIFSVPDKDGWRTITITQEMLSQNFFGKLSMLELLFTGEDATGTIYFGTASDVSEGRLDMPNNFSVNSNSKTLTWDSVANAVDYVVNIEGKIYQVSEPSFVYSDTLSKTINVKVKAICPYYSDSYWNMARINKNFELITLLIESLSFNSADYEALIIGGDRVYGWEPTSFDTSYVASVEGTNDGAVVVSYVPSISNNASIGCKVTFTPDITKDVKLRFKTDGSLANFLFISGEIAESAIYTLSADGWYVYTVPIAAFGENYNDVEIGVGLNGGTYMYIDALYQETVMAVPTGLTVNRQTGYVKWDNVTGNFGYAIEVEGDAVYTLGNDVNSYYLNSVDRIRIKTFGNGASIKSSDWSEWYYAIAEIGAQGVLADFNSVKYEEIIIGGDRVYGWEPTSFDPSYVASVEGTNDGAVVVNYVPSISNNASIGCKVTFTPDITKDVKLRFKTDGSLANFLFISGEIAESAIYTLGADGWYVYTVPIAAFGENYNDVEIGVGLNGGTYMYIDALYQ